MDMDRRLLDFIAQRIEGFNHRVQFIHSDIHVYQPAQQYDIIIFHESFHHFHDHQAVLHKVIEMLSDSGTLIFAAEPIIATPNIVMPYPWGLRMDGLSLRCVRRFGWLELGFSVPYFYALLDRFGLSYEEKRINGCHFSHLITVKRKRKSLIQVIKGLLS
jgi:SAM-dependent methyltransferase